MTTEKINKKPGRITDYNKTLPILELYTCIQSEGSRQGRPTVGCTHRCWFGAGGWCDSWYTSIHPGKGTYTFNDIIKIYDENPGITEMMLTGGSPTMQPDLCNELTHFANERGIFITIETEGSHFVETDYPIGLISLSPKFSNSVPKLDSDYHYKPVYDGTEENIQEIEEFRVKHNIPKNKTWLMPAGDNREELIKQYPISLEKAFEMGYNWTGRDHIISYDTKRAV